MDRETALRQLQEIRQEILIIHAETETCQALQKQVETLQNEKEHPVPPTATRKPENTGAALKQSFERQNRERIAHSTLPKTLRKVVCVAAQVLVALLLGLDVFGQRGLIISPAALLMLNKEDSANGVYLFAVHLLLALAAMLVALLGEGIGKVAAKWKVILGVITVALLFMYVTMCSGVGTFAYLFLLLGGVVLALVLGGIVLLVQKGKCKAPTVTLSSAQKKQVQEALAADKRAKAENAQRLAEAQSRWEEERQRRLPKIDCEIREKVQSFRESRQRIDRHMEQLGTMDALCEEDKNLQTVELLIRFIQTRRADSVKEALQEYDKLMANQQLLEIEKQKLAAELKRASQEHSDRMQQLEEQRRHQSEMEYLTWDSAQSRAKMVGQLDHLGAMIYYDLHA